MFNFTYIYSFVPMSGCVGMGIVYCFSREPVMLLRRPCFYCYYPNCSREGLHMWNATVTLLFRYFSR